MLNNSILYVNTLAYNFSMKPWNLVTQHVWEHANIEHQS